ncbi:MAG: hypothetical protein ABI298_07885 [Acidimicrobiales bacterium]
MRKIVIVGVVASSLGLAACGSSASINDTVASLGSSSTVQVHLTATASGQGVSAEAQSILKQVSMDVNYATTNGSPITDAGKAIDTQVTLNYGGSALLDLRSIDQNFYVEFDLTSLSNIPGLGISAQELASAQLVLGGRWFELPYSVLKSYAKKLATSPSEAQIAQEKSIDNKVLDALASLIDSTHSTTLASGGYTETGTLDSVVQALLPTLNTVTHMTIPAPKNVKGTYTLTLNASGTTATGASIVIAAPNGTQGDATVGLHATIAHNNVTVAAPTGATIITPALIKQLSSLAGA